jgi:hypothetical protein
METEKKSLQINAVLCDMREISEEVLKEHETVRINAPVVIMTKESKELVAKYNVSINSVCVKEIEGNAEIAVKNGNFKIIPEQKPAVPTILVVNGLLNIAPNTEDVLSGYSLIIVNGKASCPDNMSGNAASIQVNGKMDFYPSDAVMLKKTFVLDKVFILRAEEANYYASSRVVILDNSLDVKRLSEKKVHFTTPKALIAEGMAEETIGLFDSETDITLLPDGCAFINDDAVFSEKVLRRYGDKLYINGDLTINTNAEDSLKQLKYLNVNGTVKISKNLHEAFEEIDVIYDDIIYVKGIIIENKPNVEIDKNLLERNPQGITVCDCAKVRLSEDIQPEMIGQSLQFWSCAMVKCSPEQRSAVELVSNGTNIVTSKNDKLFNLISSENTKCINSIEYKF